MTKAQEKTGELAQLPDPAAVVTPMALLERALEKDVDPERLEKLMDLQDRWQSKQAETAFAQAMNRCQGEIGRISADKSNSQTRSLYASYAALDRALRPVYARHGLALSFDTGEWERDDEILVLCHVSHEAGHTRTYRAAMPADGKGAKGRDFMTKTHAAGSAMSYGMRYLLKLIFNVAIGDDPDDDDGNAASTQEVMASDKQLAEIQDFVGAGKVTDQIQAWLKERGNRIAAKDAQRLLDKLRAEDS